MLTFLAINRSFGPMTSKENLGHRLGKGTSKGINTVSMEMAKEIQSRLFRTLNTWLLYKTERCKKTAPESVKSPTELGRAVNFMCSEVVSPSRNCCLMSLMALPKHSNQVEKELVFLA